MSAAKCFRARAVPALALALATVVGHAQPGRGPSPVVGAVVIERQVTESQPYVGSVEPVKHAVIGSAVAGRVVECPIEEGDRVAASAELAQLLTETISLQIAAAAGELELRQERLNELENGSRQEDIRQAEAEMKAANARQKFLYARLRRLEAAARIRGAVTEDQVEEARANAEEAEQVYLQRKAAHELVVAGPREELKSQARAEMKIQQAELERLEDQRRKYTVRSRFDGYVVEKLTDVGSWLNQGDPVAEVVAVDEVDVVAQVNERSLPHVKPGQRVQVVFPALPGRVFEGAVQATVPLGDLRTRTFPVKVRLRNEISEAGPLLKPGMYARVTLPTGGQKQATLAPKDAVVLGGPTPMIYVAAGAVTAGATTTVRPVSVTLGIAQHGLIEVSGDVSAGDVVIVQGNERLRPNQQIVVTEIVSANHTADLR